MSRRPSRLARRIFRPLLYADGPAKLDLRGVNRDVALRAVREVGERVRCFDSDDPLDALYVFAGGSRGDFLSTWDRVKVYLRMFFYINWPWA